MVFKFPINLCNLPSQISLLAAAGLYFVWPLPHTMALRYLLLLIVAITGIILCARDTDYKKIIKQPWLLGFAALLGWVVIHAAFLSSNGIEAWHELSGEWFKAYLAVLGGIGVALASRSLKDSTFKLCFAIVLAAQPILFLILSATKSIQQGQLAFDYWGLVDHKMSLAFFSHLMVAFACAKLLDTAKSTLNAGALNWLFLIALGFYIAIMTSTRNSLIILSILCVMTSALLAHRASRNIPKIARAGLLTVIMAVMLSGIVFSFKTNTNWHSFVSDAKIAVQIDTYPNWINREKYGLPKNEQGVGVSDSNYARIAFIVAGIETTLQHPLGYGVTRHAFERLVRIEHPDANIANSHNGYIDLVASVGFPALILLVTGVALALKQIRASGSDWAKPATWMLAVIMLHWMLDPISREHYLEAFLFLIGLFSTLSLRAAPRRHISHLSAENQNAGA